MGDENLVEESLLKEGGVGGGGLRVEREISKFSTTLGDSPAPHSLG